MTQFLLASARIAENNLVGPQQNFADDCRKLPGVDDVVRGQPNATRSKTHTAQMCFRMLV